jgi:hypothetical protein
VATRTLVIVGSDPTHFALAVDGGTLRLGDSPAHTEGLIRDLRVVRIRCEVEVEDGRESIPIDEPGVIAPRSLKPGAEVRLAHVQLALPSSQLAESSSPADPAGASTDTELDTPALSAAGPKRLKVIDGGDQGSTFRLPASGTVAVGKEGGPAEIALHDLYVSKVHCKLLIADNAVTVAPVDAQAGTLIDGQRIIGPKRLKTGGVLRVGNSHLRLELAPEGEEPSSPAPVTRPQVEGSAVRRVVAQSVSPSAAKSDDPFAALVGQTLGHYEVGPMLGRGYTGGVFRATNTKSGQAVALKVLAADFPASNAELERFAQELKAVQHIRHPNLIAPLGAGRSGAHCWIAREFVDGESAADVIGRITEGEKSSWTRAARVAVHLARALDGLHQQQIVHGNITPRNVLLRAADHATKLADLRFAQAIAASKLHTTVLEAKLLAELPYLAPEQAEPDAFVDRLADLYAVGAVAYALATGRPPVSGESPSDILDQLQAGRVLRPSAIYRKVPAAFDAIVMKLLAHNQEDRYQTAAALLADLEPLGQSHDLKL